MNEKKGRSEKTTNGNTLSRVLGILSVLGIIIILCLWQTTYKATITAFQEQKEKITNLEKNQGIVKELQKDLKNNGKSLKHVKKELLKRITVLEQRLINIEKQSKKRDLVLDSRLTSTTRRVNDIDKTFFELSAKSKKDTNWKKNYDKYLKTQNQSLWDSVATTIKKKLKNSGKHFSLITIK